MKTKLLLIAVVLAVSDYSNYAADNPSAAPSETGAAAPLFANLADAKWNPILPALGADSPQICILRADPTTKMTQLLIRAPKAIHVRKHWHTGNETHTMIHGTATFGCDGRKMEQGPGSFNYMPAKMVHEAWLSAGSLAFITTDAGWDVNWVEGPPTAADLTK